MLLYHLVCPTKYRRVIFDRSVEQVLKEICLEISDRYQIEFLEIGTDLDHVHFLLQSVPTYSPTKIARIVKSLTGREIFRRCPEVKKKLWGGQFWTDGYFMNTVGQKGNENSVAEYVREQGKDKEYKKLYRSQLKLF